MVAGLTMVITDCAGRPDGFVDGLHGWVVASGDTAALREGLRQRLDMPADAVAGLTLEVEVHRWHAGRRAMVLGFEVGLELHTSMGLHAGLHAAGPAAA